jgi:hypothetical protein
MSDTMFPTDFEVPSNSNKFLQKFEEGDTKILILAAPVFGFVKREFAEDKKMIGEPEFWKYPDQKITPTGAKFFMGIMLYNFRVGAVQYLELKMKGLINDIANLEKQGHDLFTTELIITRKGSTKDNTEYKVAPVPPKVNKGLTEEIKQELSETEFDLEKIFSDGSPFPKQGETLEKDEDTSTSDPDIDKINVQMPY